MLARAAWVADRLVEAVAVTAALALLAVVVLGIAFRLANDPLVWSDEAARYLMVWVALLGWIIAGRRHSHIRITVIVDRLPARARAAVEIIIQSAVAGFGIALAAYSLTLVTRNLDVEAVSLPVPSALLYLLVPLAGAAVALQALAAIARVLGTGAAPR